MRLTIFIVFHFIIFGLKAQNSIFKNQEVSLSIGLADINVEKFTPDKNIDFLNHSGTNFTPLLDDPYSLYNPNDTQEDYPSILVKWSYRADLFSKISVDVKLILFESLIPDNYDISAHYFFKSWLGIGAGSMLNKNWISGFEQFQIETLSDYYIVDTNFRQFTTYELGFYISPILKLINNDVFNLQIRCDFGLSAFSRNEENFYHQKKDLTKDLGITMK